MKKSILLSVLCICFSVMLYAQNKGSKFFDKASDIIGDYPKTKDKKALEKSLVYLDKSIKKEKLGVRPFMLKGVAHFYQEKYQEAIDDLTEVINASSASCNIYTLRGDCYIQLQKLDRALKDYEEAIDRDCEAENLYYRIAGAYFDANKPQSALYYYNKCLEENPENMYAYDGRGGSYLIMKNYQKAVDDFNKVLEIDPTFASSYNGLGLAYAGLKDYEAAEKSYLKSIELYPQGPFADYTYNNLGNCYFYMGKTDKACEYWQISIDMNYVFNPIWREQYNIEDPKILKAQHCK